MSNSDQVITHRDPAETLLRERELRALKLSSMVRAAMILIMAPMAWALGTNLFDQVATFVLLSIYLLVLASSAWLVKHRDRLTTISLMGVALDVCVIATLPFIWHTTLGGSELPAGTTLKSSVTLIALLFIALNTLAMRPLYPVLVTIGALLVHLFLLAIGLEDSRTEFTHSYLLAYTTPAISIGRATTQLVVILMVGMVLTLMTMRARSMIVEAAQLQKKNIQLGRYFSPNLVHRLENTPELLGVGGSRKDLSFVFTDLEGFTSLVEENEPAVVVPLLNQYLDTLVQIAFKHEGTVEKIVGDALHIIFGAPEEQPDHAERAVKCALELDVAAERFRNQARAQVAFGITRIGVNSGAAIVGNFGGEKYFDYTAYGDSINTAARLEGANKYLGTRICVSGETRSRIADFRGRPVGVLILKGKQEEIEVFEPLGENGTGIGSVASYLSAYEALKAREPDAYARFQAYCRAYPEDALAKFHLVRLRNGQSGANIKLASK